MKTFEEMAEGCPVKSVMTLFKWGNLMNQRPRFGLKTVEISIRNPFPDIWAAVYSRVPMKGKKRGLNIWYFMGLKIVWVKEKK